MAECDRAQEAPRVVHGQTMEDDSGDDDLDPLIRNTANALARTKDRLQNNPWLIAPNNGLHAHVDRMHAVPAARRIPAPQPMTGREPQSDVPRPTMNLLECAAKRCRDQVYADNDLRCFAGSR